MTGAELGPIIGVGKAAAAIGKKASIESNEGKVLLARLAEDTPEMRTAAEVYARRKLLVQQVRLRVLKPLGLFAGLNGDYFQVKFPEDLASKLAHVPEGDLRSPQPSVAGPALTGLSYSHTEEDLKELYLNLLASASNSQTADAAHPAFGTIIQQLSPDEAALLLTVLKSSARPLVTVSTSVPADSVNDTPSLNRVYSNVLNWPTLRGRARERGLADYARYVDNWVRLGLVRIDTSNFLTRRDAYDWAGDLSQVKLLKDSVAQADPASNVQIDQGVLWRTDFGLTFRFAVAPNVPATPPATSQSEAS